MTDGTLQPFFSAERYRNPFVRISQSGRIFIVAYFVFWRLLPSFANLDAQNLTHAVYTSAISILTVCTESLILLPFLMRRFAGMPVGWLHPLILPTLVGIAFGLIRNPSSLLTPISAWYQATPIVDHVLLDGWPDAAKLATQLEVNIINLLAIVSTYMGFALLRSGISMKSHRRILISGFKLAVFFVLCLLVVAFFLQQQGGVISHMSTFAGGRFRMRELSGHFLVINGFLPYTILLWYTFQPKALSNPIFLIGLAVAIGLQFIVTGSRSEMFSPIALLLAVWMFHNRRVPAARALLLGLVVVLLLGVLGQVRQSGRSGTVDFSTLTEIGVAAAWESTQAHISQVRR